MSGAEVIQLSPTRARPIGRHDPIGVLDVGTSKMCCLIARQRPRGGWQVLGLGHQLAEGLRAGEIVDAEAAEASILAVVHEAEQQAGEGVREVVLGLSGGRPQSEHTTIELPLGGREVRAFDLATALAHARAQAQAAAGGHEILHVLPIQATLDDGQPLIDPRGMIGHRLRLVIHLVRLRAAAVRNLVATVERCHLEVAGMVAAPYAAGLACLSEDEAALGALVLDFGAGVTGIARFAHGRLQAIDTVPVGGRHVTQDLAYGLNTGRAEAERLKALYGSVLGHAGDERERLALPSLGDPDVDRRQIVSRARLTEIVRPRVEEIFQLVQGRVDLDQMPLAGRRLVLTGGASQLEGMTELAEELLGMPARLGRARSLDGSEGLEGLAAATTAAGLLTWAGHDDGGLTLGAHPAPAGTTNRLSRLGQWLRENF